MKKQSDLKILQSIHKDVLSGGIKKNALRKRLKKELNNDKFKSDDLSALFYDYFDKGLKDCAIIYSKIFPEIIKKKSFYVKLITEKDAYVNDSFLQLLLDNIINTDKKGCFFLKTMNEMSNHNYGRQYGLSIENRFFIYKKFIDNNIDVAPVFLFNLFGRDYFKKIEEEDTWRNLDFFLKEYRGKLDAMIESENHFGLNAFKNEKNEIPFWLCFVVALGREIEELQDVRFFNLITKNIDAEVIKRSFNNLNLKHPVRFSKNAVKILHYCEVSTEEMESKKIYGYGDIKNIDDFIFFHDNKFNMNENSYNHFMKTIKTRLLLHKIFEYLLKNTGQILNMDVPVKRNTKSDNPITLSQYLEKNMKNMPFIHFFVKKESTIDLEETEKLLSILVDKMRLLDKIQLNDIKDNNYKKRL